MAYRVRSASSAVRLATIHLLDNRQSMLNIQTVCMYIAEGGAVDVIVVGGGVGGLSTALLLAKDGHRVRVLERDPTPPPADPAAAWTRWTDRRGVPQFHLLHSFLPRWREIVEAELPEVAAGMDAAGALR